MSFRLSEGGRLIDRTKKLVFHFNGKRLEGYAGDSLASALLASDQMIFGRSFKYHRPRGIVASGPEEPNALMGIGREGKFEPNQRASVTPLFNGLEAVSQNHWPSLDFDIGAINNWFARFLPAGFYYKTFIHPRAFWKTLYEPFIRHAAGLGKAPTHRDADCYEHFYGFYDILVIGGGVSGLLAAKEAGAGGAKVLLVEQSAHWGGRSIVDGGQIDGHALAEWVTQMVSELSAMPNVTMRLQTSCSGIYDHGYAICCEHPAAYGQNPNTIRHRLWRIRAKKTIAATGAIERPLSFPGNDIPGVMLAGAMRDYLVDYATVCSERTVIVTNNDSAYLTALALIDAGLEVPAIIDARGSTDGPLPQRVRAAGVSIYTNAALSSVLGKRRVRGVKVSSLDGLDRLQQKIPCDGVAMSGGWSPVVHHWSHCGGKLNWDATQSFFRPNHDLPPLDQNAKPMVCPVGTADGWLHLGEILPKTQEATHSVLKELGFKPAKSKTFQIESPAEAPSQAVWMMPQNATISQRNKMWLDFQNDVKVSDIQLAAREGYESVEHAKRYTTLGMATDQGKLSNINGLAILSESLNTTIPQTGTTTFRPPYTPIPFGAITGNAHGDLFQPIRKTALHSWHESNGAYWEPVGGWRRPYTYIRAGETIKQAVHREVVNTRTNLGLLDASTLGKLIVKGPDAGKFLDMLYTNMMSTLKLGSCRYGLMCDENGFLIDDGVVARLDDETFLCHTTSGGADRIHAHMEQWLQTEWWDWRVWVVNATEQFAQIAVVGPHARNVLERLGGMDVSAESLPFMTWKDGQIGGINVRNFRISFSGELSYEIAVPTADARRFWDMLYTAGAEFGVMAYGTEALHIMRAEKGFIMIGDETDGTVIPQDLELGWAISKKKADFLGKRAQKRSFMDNDDRWRLVGLETLDGGTLPDGVYAVAAGKNANNQRNVIGRVTSTYYSPTLERGIALGLVQHGPERVGEILDFVTAEKKVIRAKIVSPVFYDPEGRKQNV